MYLMMLKKKIRKKNFNRKEMVGEMQPFLSVYPNRNKEHLNTNVGSESSISLLRKDLFQCKTSILPGKACVSTHKKSTRIHPLLRELWPLKQWSFFKISDKNRFQRSLIDDLQGFSGQFRGETPLIFILCTQILQKLKKLAHNYGVISHVNYLVK